MDAGPFDSGEAKDGSKRGTMTKAEYERRWQRRYNLKYDFGITVEDYDRMFAAQGGVCSLCKRPPKIKKDGTPKWGACRLAVDHDHFRAVPKSVRGLLCASCNRLIVGILESHQIRLDDLILYLRGRSVACDPENTPLDNGLYLESKRRD